MRASYCGLGYSQDFMEEGSALGLKDGDTSGGRDSFVYAFTQLSQTPLAVLGQDEE